jgi:hypothetical protein
MAQGSRGFKEVVNEALRRGLTDAAEEDEYRLPTFELGEPLVPLDQALQLAAELEDDERRRKLERRK